MDDDVRCRLCGGVAAPWVPGYLACGACGYVQVEREALPDADRARERYLLHRNDPSDRGYVAWLERFIDAAVEPFMPRGSVLLDYGSGPTAVLSGLLRGRGYDLTSWDPFFEPGADPFGRAWDAIVVHEVAEHLAEPGAELGALAASLRAGGCLCIRTRFPPPTPEAFRSWWYRSDFTHVGFFTPATFGAFAARSGMDVILLLEPDTVVLRTAAVAR